MKLNIGQNLRSLRRSADMTQDELAVKLGVTFQTVSRWDSIYKWRIGDDPRYIKLRERLSALLRSPDDN